MQSDNYAHCDFRLIVHATNVHYGGGSLLLSSLLDACSKRLHVVVQIDSRMLLAKAVTDNFEIRYVHPSIWQRFRAEWWLMRHAKSQDTVLCFGNLPPLFRLRGHVIVFVQNRYLVIKTATGNFSLKTKLRLAIERLWLAWRSGNSDQFLVQTPSMKKDLLSSGCVTKQPVHVKPFACVSGGYQRKIDLRNVWQNPKKFDFVYPASGDPHKNHRRLVEAWCLLAKQDLFPSLCLTVDEHLSKALCTWIDEQKLRYGLKLENIGPSSHDQVRQLYSQARALIFPSLFESFGLPLIEARQAGLPVLASELDYVRDVLDPEESFDSCSPKSIAMAVKRFMGVKEAPLQLLSSAEFLEHVLERMGHE